MKKSITKNYLYNMSYQILKIIVPLVTTPYLSRTLGAEAIGIYSYTLSVVTYFILFGTLGISLYGQREIAYVQDNKKERSKIFWEINLLRFITVLFSLIIFYLSFCRCNKYEFYYKILILELISNIVDISWYFQGMEEFKKTVIRNTVIKLISVLCIFIIIKNSTDLYKYFIIYVLSNFLGNVSLWLYLPKYIQRISMREIKIWRHLKPTISLFIPQIAIQVYTVLDKTMIGAMIEEKDETGFYEQAEKIVKVLLTIITSLGTVMLSRVANTFAIGNKEQIKLYIKRSFNIVYFLAFPMIFGIISISNQFVPIFFGMGYDKVKLLIKVLSPIILIIGLSNVVGNQLLITTKRHKEYTVSVFLGAGVNLILNLILIKFIKSIGASIATVIAELVVTITQLYFIKKDINVKEIIKNSINYFMAGIIMFLICLIVKRIIIVDIISILIQVILGALTYFISLLLLKDKFFYEIIDMIKEKIIGGKNERI